MTWHCLMLPSSIEYITSESKWREFKPEVSKVSCQQAT